MQKMKKKQQEEEVKELEDNENHSDLPKSIEALEEMGIGMQDINKLKKEGFCTVKSLLMYPKKILCEIKGISEAKLEKIIECAMKLENLGFTNGLVVLEKRKHVLKITTGSSKLDELLQGGIESMSITEVFGEFRTGKTQLCHTLAVTAQLDQSKGGGGGKVVYIDTVGTFRPNKIAKIAERFGLDPTEALRNIIYGRVYTTEIQDNLLTLAAAQMMEEKFSLLIIDCFISLFRTDYIGRGQLADRQQFMNQSLSKLLKLADQFNIAVLITNQVMANPGATMSFGDTKLPVGGHILAHASTTRLYLRKGKDNERICKIYDSPSLPSGEAVIALTDGGVEDAE